MSDLWVRRAYDPALDEDAIVYLWLKSYAHAPHLVAQGAHRDASNAEKRYWREHAPVVECLLRSGIAETHVLCDPERAERTKFGPPVILAFACVSDGAVHYASVKRHYARAGFGPDMLRDLLGDLLDAHCAHTHDLPEMRPGKKDGKAPSGVILPERWHFDPWWLSRQFLGGARKEAA